MLSAAPGGQAQGFRALPAGLRPGPTWERRGDVFTGQPFLL